MKKNFREIGLMLTVVIIVNLMISNIVNGQNAIMTDVNPSTVFFQCNPTQPSTTSPKICLGYQYFTPRAKFHIIGSPLTEPVLKVEGRPSNMFPATISVENCVNRSSLTYGIFQTGPSDGTGCNYFQNAVGIGVQEPAASLMLDVAGRIHTTSDMISEGDNYFRTGICSDGIRLNGNSTPNPFIECNQNSLSFIMTRACGKSSPCKFSLLTLNGTTENKSVEVAGHLKTTTFQMTALAQGNSILLSDLQGNGRWADPKTILDNYWLLNIDNDLYTQKKVGIGTQLPGDKLQINDGVSKIVFGEGPTYPYDKAVSGDTTKSFGQKEQAPLLPVHGSGYIGFNTVRMQDGWLVSGDGSSNAGSLVYNDPYSGKMLFCSINGTSDHSDQQISIHDMGQKVGLAVSNSNHVSVGTTLDVGTFTIRDWSDAEINCFSFSDKNAALWLGNTDPLNNLTRSYGLIVDQLGVCHLSANKDAGAGERSIMSFQTDNMGSYANVGVDGNLSVTGNLSVSGNEFVSGNEVIAGNEVVNGKVGIGNVDLSLYQNSPRKLFVEGGIMTEEVTVKLKSTGWYDFVFNKDYKLITISELDQYIKSNGHLPDIPTSEKVNSDGIDIGKMNALLLQKVEELTLYVIELKKEITELQKKNN